MSEQSVSNLSLHENEHVLENEHVPVENASSSGNSSIVGEQVQRSTRNRQPPTRLVCHELGQPQLQQQYAVNNVMQSNVQRFNPYAKAFIPHRSIFTPPMFYPLWYPRVNVMPVVY